MKTIKLSNKAVMAILDAGRSLDSRAASMALSRGGYYGIYVNWLTKDMNLPTVDLHYMNKHGWEVTDHGIRIDEEGNIA